MRKDLQEIRYQLKEICNKEAYRLWKQARRMQEHGVSDELVMKCKNEAFDLFNTGYPERILDDNYEFGVQFAFKETGNATIPRDPEWDDC